MPEFRPFGNLGRQATGYNLTYTPDRSDWDNLWAIGFENGSQSLSLPIHPRSPYPIPAGCRHFGSPPVRDILGRKGKSENPILIGSDGRREIR
ncbi:hypothetical protein L0F63_000605 [Massospora cicadina]|nr:hypothetical protein L0F63_000605 [Massospora cicadina]